MPISLSERTVRTLAQITAVLIEASVAVASTGHIATAMSQKSTVP